MHLGLTHRSAFVVDICVEFEHGTQTLGSPSTSVHNKHVKILAMITDFVEVCKDVDRLNGYNNK